MSEKIGLSDSILLVGCGKMGGALLAGWLDQGVSTDQILVVEPSIDAERSGIPEGVSVLKDPADITDDFKPAVVIFAVKPQILQKVVAPLANLIAEAQPLLISVAAGVTASSIERWVGGHTALIRVMPNTPALIGAGISALYANHNVSDDQRALAENIVAAVGKAV